MNQYETLMIINPNSETEVVDKIINDFQNLISGDSGVIKKLENWGKKKLAYEIKGNKDGFYILLDYEADPNSIQKLDRFCILNEQVIKHMTVRAEDLPEPRKKEITKKDFEDEDDDFLTKALDEYDDDDFDYEDDED